MISDYKFIIVLQLLFIWNESVCSQELKVMLDENTKSIDRNTSGGISTIVFDSKVKNLEIKVNGACETIKPKENLFLFRIDTKSDLQDILYQSEDNEEIPMGINRIFSLQCPKSAIYRLSVDISPNTMYYYTVILPDKFPTTLSVEWLMNDHVQNGIRIGYGARYGFLIGGTWGKYRPSGDFINSITTDCDVTHAKLKGYIRTTIFGGFRMGLWNLPDKTILIMNIGLGYGESGRQWENKVHLENSKYFYSDYIKGVNANFGLCAQLFNYLSISCGGDMIMSKGKFTMEWQMGLGFCFNTAKWFKHRL